MPHTLAIKCPKCGHTMKYLPMKSITRQSVKRCVYCGFSINVAHSLNNGIPLGF